MTATGGVKAENSEEGKERYLVPQRSVKKSFVIETNGKIKHRNAYENAYVYTRY